MQQTKYKHREGEQRKSGRDERQTETVENDVGAKGLLL
jgi:hypothetical protein